MPSSTGMRMHSTHRLGISSGGRPTRMISGPTTSANSRISTPGRRCKQVERSKECRSTTTSTPCPGVRWGACCRVALLMWIIARILSSVWVGGRDYTGGHIQTRRGIPCCVGPSFARERLRSPCPRRCLRLCKVRDGVSVRSRPISEPHARQDQKKHCGQAKGDNVDPAVVDDVSDPPCRRRCETRFLE